jgi:hypothetical protein
LNSSVISVKNVKLTKVTELTEMTGRIFAQIGGFADGRETR